MYCRYCGTQIAENSKYCSNCGKLIAESTYTRNDSNGSPVIEKENNNIPMNLVSTTYLQWQKPYLARVFQIILGIICIFLLIYSLVSMILVGGDKYGPIREASYSSFFKSYSFHWNVEDPWDLFEYTAVNNAVSIDSCRSKFRTKMWIFVHAPSILLIIFLIWWKAKTRFPKESDGLPRDVADKIQPYSWDGFSLHKYIIFQKNNKYGIIDASDFYVVEPAIYDSLIWRIPQKTCEVQLNDKKDIIRIVDRTPNNPIRKKFEKQRIYIILVLLGIFLGLISQFSLVMMFLVIFNVEESDTPALAIIGSFISFCAFTTFAMLVLKRSERYH